MVARYDHTYISIHAPRRGSDELTYGQMLEQSDFNPRSPQGERLKSFVEHGFVIDFNPRSPQGERRFTRRYIRHKNVYFNPRSPQGERPSAGVGDSDQAQISIHAPRRGSDQI